MPNPVLPAAAIEHMANPARASLLDKIDQLPFETFVRLYYSGEKDGRYIENFLVETDATHWAERADGEVYFYTELSETRDEAVLYDASRNVTIVIDYDDYRVLVTDAGTTDYLLDDIGETLYPVVPPGIF